MLRKSIVNTLGLLHDYQKQRYQQYRLAHTDVEVFRECKKWLWQTFDAVPEYAIDDEYIDASATYSPGRSLDYW